MPRVEVVYALPQRQYLMALEVEDGCTAIIAVQRSGVLQTFPELEGQPLRLGIFGEELADPAARRLLDGDRVEIYRPLLIDPKAVRRQRAARAKR